MSEVPLYRKGPWRSTMASPPLKSALYHGQEAVVEYPAWSTWLGWNPIPNPSSFIPKPCTRILTPGSLHPNPHLNRKPTQEGALALYNGLSAGFTRQAIPSTIYPLP